MAEKKSKTTWQTITISKDTLEDCLSSWLTATRTIEKTQFVTAVIPGNQEAGNLFYPEEIPNYLVRVERIVNE